MRFSLIILALNEIEGMKAVLPRIDKKWVDEIIIVDGGSTDGSVEYARELGFHVLQQKGKGVLAGYREGMEAATGDIIITFTPDGNMIPEKLPELVEKMKEGYDMVIVSRYKDAARSYDDTLLSGFGNWMFTTMVNVLFRTDYTDVLGFYRAYKKDLFKGLGIDKDLRISLDTQLCIRCAKKGLRVAEIPGDEPKRVGGESIRCIVRNGLVELLTITEEFIKRDV